ncbi:MULTISPECIES: cbb3-type cytochrome oxidase assembly protein CcoS [unclassified Shewanella]|uniref:cbb3-type cytochrome oxidase assembly protein CcoS n=1 Tax=unclassified Shewanella TaxID=196818 RepID=UPI0021DA39A9|nr:MULTISPECIES: cbb3-type cytochrome oxidase assembly protein CcoS [unclassified Shewanella]MCU8069121.1 cbb3-type cytochrome oxidase assembly protein CcoS [Shewanella sp. SM32]MCU8086446.1 cbb3-type cytochrome oxidase assembly protein CcoS [Shewanella sp. SM21]
MEIIYVLIPIAMIFVAIAVMVFFWAVKSEQFDDLDRQSVSILFDENTDKPGHLATPAIQSTAEKDDVVAQQAIKNQQKGMLL